MQSNTAKLRLSGLRVMLNSLPFHGARGGLPPGIAVLFLEVRSDNKRFVQILGVGHDDRDYQHGIAVMLLEHVVVLDEIRVFAVRNTILAQVASLQMRRGDLQRS